MPGNSEILHSTALASKDNLMSALQRIQALALVTLTTAAGSPHAFDVQHSKVTVRVYKQGLFSFLADDHEVIAPISAGSYDSAAKAVEVTLDATKMRVLDPRLPSQKRDQVQANMAGPQALDVAAYPTISFRSTKIDDADSKRWTVTGDLTLHGQTHPVTFHVVKADSSHFNGSAVVRQTAFGITPIRIAGGAVAVRDDVTIEFSIEIAP
jgi:polyisoprenoid-binding protein YceI